MADRKRHDPAYGAFGHAFYDPDAQFWKFARSTIPSASIKCVEALANPSASARHSDRQSSKDIPSRRRAKQIRALIEAYPEVAPARDFLPNPLRISEAVIDATSQHDQAKGRLLTVHAVHDERLNPLSSIIVSACGPNGCDLSFVTIVVQREQWSGSRDFWFDIPSLGGVSRIWNGPGVPIHSIASANPIGRGDRFLALTLPTKTLFFRPRIHSPTKTGSSVDETIIGELSIEDTGGVSHSDIAFNPWNTRQVALVDTSGSISVWKLPLRKTRSIVSLYREEVYSPADSEVCSDQWRRISWIYDSSMLATCSRRAVHIYYIGDEHMEPLKIEFGIQSSTCMILDFKWLPSMPQCIGVLSSTHLWLFRLRRAADGTFDVQREVYIPHYKNPEDFTLQLQFLLHGDDLLALIHSGMDPIVVSYRLQIRDDTVVMYEPSDAGFITDSHHHSHQQITRDLAFVSAQSVNAQYLDRQDRTPVPVELQGATLYTLLTLDGDYELHQSLYAIGAANDVQLSSGQMLRSGMRSAARHRLVGHSNADAGESKCIGLKEPKSRYSERRARHTAAVAADYRTISYRHTVSLLNDVAQTPLSTFQHVIEQARNLLQNGTMSKIHTVRELVETESKDPVLTDMAGSLETLRIGQLQFSIEDSNAFGNDKPVACRSLPLGSILGLPSPQSREGTNAGFRDLLNDSLRHFHFESSPEPTHLSSEKLGRQMAAELTLASLVLRREESPEEQPLDVQKRVDDWQLPLRSANVDIPNTTGRANTDRSSQRQSTRDATPSATTPGPRSTTTGSSYSAASVAPEVFRLSRYTTFSEEKLPSGLPRRLNKVLRSWVTGTDPSTYDWRSSTRNASQPDDEQSEDEDMTDRDRRRLQRKAERSLRRQRREAEESLRQQRLSSQAPQIVSASQPQPSSSSRRPSNQQVGAASQPFFGSSQPTGFGQMPASQVLPGRHGGRPASKKRRRSGF